MATPAPFDLNSVELDAYLGRLASAAATPGGGAAVALTGAQGAALLSMVCNLSRGERYAGARAELDAVNARCEQGIRRLLDLATEDAVRFEAVIAAYGLPRSAETERAGRTAAIQQALRGATQTPLAVLDEARELLRHCGDLARLGNPSLASDLGIAVHLLDACVRGARLNVLINLRQIPDPDFRAASMRAVAAALAELEGCAPEVLAQVEARLA
jgi:formiminotetrahydrofolate cyclodeaminase